MTYYSLQSKVLHMERIIIHLICQIKNLQNQGSINETDPIYTSSLVSQINQSDLDFIKNKDYTSLNNTPDRTPQIITTNVSEYSLTPTGGTILLTFYGTTTNLVLPTVADHLGQVILLYNGGTGDVTISSNPSDEDVIIDGGMTMNSTNLTAGSPMTLFSSLVGTELRWIAKP